MTSTLRVGSFLQSASDCQWLREVHLKGVKYPAFKSALLYGNDDCPEAIELYADRNPHYQADPVAVFKPDAADRVYRAA